MSDDKPMKSAYELAMERLNKKDEEAGVEHRPLTDEQRAAIAEVRSIYQAKLAEAEIRHQDAVRSAPDPTALQGVEDDYQAERGRLTRERDSKVEKLRG